MKDYSNFSDLQKDLVSKGAPESESPIDVHTFGRINTALLVKWTSSTGKLYYKGGNYKFATKSHDLEVVTIKLLTANKDFKGMKKGDCFIVAE